MDTVIILTQPLIVAVDEMSMMNSKDIAVQWRIQNVQEEGA